MNERRIGRCIELRPHGSLLPGDVLQSASCIARLVSASISPSIVGAFVGSSTPRRLHHADAPSKSPFGPASLASQRNASATSRAIWSRSASAHCWNSGALRR
jgi:hypothetical protein